MAPQAALFYFLCMSGEEVAVLMRMERRSLVFYLFSLNSPEHSAFLLFDLGNLAGCRAVPFPMVQFHFLSSAVNVYLVGRKLERGVAVGSAGSYSIQILPVKPGRRHFEFNGQEFIIFYCDFSTSAG